MLDILVFCLEVYFCIVIAATYDVMREKIDFEMMEIYRQSIVREKDISIVQRQIENLEMMYYRNRMSVFDSL